jgi:2-methylaconitate cis-trans-isomerase PrpF
LYHLLFIFMLALSLLVVLAGIALGCIAAAATEVTDRMIMAAAEALGQLLTPQELQEGSVLPRIDRLRCTAGLKLGLPSHHRIAFCELHMQSSNGIV